MVIQKEKGGGGGREEGCARANASPLGRVHSGPTLTFPGPGAEERDRERGREKNWRMQKLRVTKRASINPFIKRHKCLNCDKRLPGLSLYF